jgi:hypothetical protein
MLKGKLGVLVLAALLYACGENGERLPQQLKTIQHPPGIEVAGVRVADGILGRAEAVASLKVNAAYRSSSIADHYKKQLSDSGWEVCSGQMLNAWAEIVDATSGAQKTKSQLVMRFSKGKFDGEILLEQEKPSEGAVAKNTPGMGYLRITTPASSSCSPKK